MALIVGAMFAASNAVAADRLRIAVQKTGTLAWELEILRAHDLDRQADLAIETTELASTEAGKIALKGGAADMILSDWLWVTRERSLGDDLVFYPYSSALGAVMVPANSPIAGVADLKGRKLGVAGGPLDKSWLLLQALGAAIGHRSRERGADRLRRAAAPDAKGAAGRDRCDADVLEFLCRARGQGHAARHRHEGRRQTRSARPGRSPWSATSSMAAGRRAIAHRSIAFSPPCTRLKTFSRTRPANGSGSRRASGSSDAGALEIYRRRFVEGIPHRSRADEEADARALYRVMAEVGGADLVGPARELDPGTFYRAEPGE